MECERSGKRGVGKRVSQGDGKWEKWEKINIAYYYHFRPTLKRDDFFAYVYFLNSTVLSGYVSL